MWVRSCGVKYRSLDTFNAVFFGAVRFDRVDSGLV